MKVSEGSARQKLVAANVDSTVAEAPEKEAQRQPAFEAIAQGIQSGVEANAESAVLITRVASGDGEADRAEVEAAVREASRSTVDDVEKFADSISRQIKLNQDQAVNAHSKLMPAKVQELLS